MSLSRRTPARPHHPSAHPHTAHPPLARLRYQRIKSNALAIAAHYQVLFTFAGAFVILCSDFPYDDGLLGVALVVANILVLPFMVYLGKRPLKLLG